MSTYLTINETDLKANNSYWTAREICQQPRVWLEAAQAIDSARQDIDAWLQPLLNKSDLRIVLSGAGTSAFIGDTLAPWLRKKLNRRIEAISTTDLVGDPGQYLAEDLPTLMISFARSGDSPESVASVYLANQVLSDCHHLVLTCNPQGYLAKSAESNPNMLCILMPEGTNDRSFAMTSSYSSMLVSCASIFTPAMDQLDKAAQLAEGLIATQAEDIRELAEKDFTRLVVLGAGCLLGTACEASLKCLELSAGIVVPLFDSPLGFRHGPKSVVDTSTVIIHLHSSDPYMAGYDHDLFNEITADNQAAAIIALSLDKLKAPEILGVQARLDDIWLSLPYILYCQILAFYKALALNITADNPCPSGEVNRVVKGVTIYPYKAA